jgi:CHAT domain-containing protein/tetratricopeptide (TPR) repeat protein
MHGSRYVLISATLLLAAQFSAPGTAADGEVLLPKSRVNLTASGQELPKRWRSEGSGAVFQVIRRNHLLIIERVLSEEERRSPYGLRIYVELRQFFDVYQGVTVVNQAVTLADGTLAQCPIEATYRISSLSTFRIEGIVDLRPLVPGCGDLRQDQMRISWTPTSDSDESPPVLPRAPSVEQRLNSKWKDEVVLGFRAQEDGDLLLAAELLERGTISAPASERDSTEFGYTLQALGTSYERLGRLPDADRTLVEACAVLRRHRETGPEALLNCLIDLERVQGKQGKLEEALDTNIEAVAAIDAMQLGATSVVLFDLLHHQAYALTKLGRSEDSIRVFTRADGILQSNGRLVQESADTVFSHFYPDFAFALYTLNDYTKAEGLISRVVKMAESQGPNSARLTTNFLLIMAAKQIEGQHHLVDAAMANAKRGLSIAAGEDNALRWQITQGLGVVADAKVMARRDIEERLSILRLVVNILRRQREAPNDERFFIRQLLVYQLSMLFGSLPGVNAVDGANLLTLAIKHLDRIWSPSAWTRSELVATRGQLYAKTGDWDRAEPDYIEALEIDLASKRWPEWLGNHFLATFEPHAKSPDVVRTWRPLIKRLQQLAEKEPALLGHAEEKEFREVVLSNLDLFTRQSSLDTAATRDKALSILASMRRLYKEGDFDNDFVTAHLSNLPIAQREMAIFAMLILPYIERIQHKNAIGELDDRGRAALFNELKGALAERAFFLQQTVSLARTGAELSIAAARLEAEGPEAASTIAALRESRRRSSALVLQLARMASLGAGESANAPRLQKELGEALRQESAFVEKLREMFPSYFSWIDRTPVDVKQVQAVLRDKEALVLHSLGPMQFGIVIRKNAIDLELLKNASRKEVIESIGRFVRQLDPTRLMAANAGALKFNGKLASTIYAALFGSLEKHLDRIEHVIIVPTFGLESLPFSALLTEPSQDEALELSKLPVLSWLAKKHAVSLSPTVRSFVAARQLGGRRGKGHYRPFFGVGNPRLDGGSSSSRQLRYSRVLSRGSAVTAEELRALDALPESETELKGIARTLGARDEDLLLGEEATEGNVKRMDLSRYRIVAFATHGLMAGELRPDSEPGLVLTPPAVPTELDNGLLTTTEIASLNLDAELVVLSACNTSASDGTPGAEGLSGLARAFFMAGARALLVSHWPVSSDAAVDLTTRMSLEMSKGAQKAEALRRAMLSLLDVAEMPHYAHPMFWAPFVVVGD